MKNQKNYEVIRFEEPSDNNKAIINTCLGKGNDFFQEMVEPYKALYSQERGVER